MTRRKHREELAKVRSAIGRKVRRLREARQWTQKALSSRLGLSQPRLSEIERGAGSFTAEQFLTILKIFNASVSDFDFSQGTPAPHSELQNALARLGASHLYESENVLPKEGFDDVGTVVIETLVTSAPRLLTALGPVLVQNIDVLRLEGLHARLQHNALEQRLAWLVENVGDAVRVELTRETAPKWRRTYKRAELVFDQYLRFAVAHASPRPAGGEDILDREVRSERTLDTTRASSSTVSKRWGIISSIQPEDFSEAMRAARGRD